MICTILFHLFFLAFASVFDPLKVGIEHGISRVRPWNELLATGAQTTWLFHPFLIISKIDFLSSFN